MTTSHEKPSPIPEATRAKKNREDEMKRWFLSLLGFIYLVAFSSLYIQKPGLYGKNP